MNIFSQEREKVGGEKGGKRRGVGSVVNPVRGFPSPCGKPIGFSIGAALSMPQSEGEKGEVTFSLSRRRRRSFAPPFPPSRPQAFPAAADFLFGTFSFARCFYDRELSRLL